MSGATCDGRGAIGLRSRYGRRRRTARGGICAALRVSRRLSLRGLLLRRERVATGQSPLLCRRRRRLCCFYFKREPSRPDLVAGLPPHACATAAQASSNIYVIAQRASRRHDGLVVWDYHVVLAVLWGESFYVYDLDTTVSGVPSGVCAGIIVVPACVHADNIFCTRLYIFVGTVPQ